MEKAVYRIIDANFNRGREASRVMEEYCRFVLNSAVFAGRCKSLRHRLCGAIGKLDRDKLIAGRDAELDVGREMRIPEQMGRKNIKECFIAAARRFTEALRALAESAQTLDSPAAAVFEQLRFESYTLEKEILSFSSGRKKFAGVRLYVIVTATKIDQRQEKLKLAEKCVAGGADCIQLRCKGITDDEFFRLGTEMAEVCRAKGALCIINDRVDIAVVTGADGVHLGQDDLAIEQGRRLQLSPLIFGVSTHNMNQLNRAIEQGVTYVGIGPVYPTTTKPDIKLAGLGYVRSAVKVLSETGIGHTVIGGINLENIDDVLKAGAGSIAVCSAAANAEDPKSFCSRVREKIISC